MSELFDLIIVGGGPAGLAAAIYGGRARRKTLVIEKGNVGGRAYTTREIVNYPGVPDTTGPDLAALMRKQAEGFGVRFKTDQIKEYLLEGDIKVLKSRRNTYEAKAVILAPGTGPRILGIKGERELSGRGVAYCATCDAEFFKDQRVFVLGSGDQAVEESIFIAKYAKEVTILSIHEDGKLDCNALAKEKVLQVENIDILYHSTIDEVLGEEEVRGVVVKDLNDQTLKEYPCEGVFFFVGMVPNTEKLRGYRFLDQRGWICTNEMMETGIDGVYAAGDARQKYLRQIATSVSDGAIAATAAERYLEETEGFEKLMKTKEKFSVCFWDPQIRGSGEELSKILSEEKDCIDIDVSRNKTIAKKYSIVLSEDEKVKVMRFENRD